MAFDGITVAAVTKELSEKTKGTRIYKIAQPEPDEILLTIKGNSTQFRILLSADASLPLVYITDENKPSPQTAPGFCMLLRKHLTNAKIISVTQPGLERAVIFELEHLNEMGDLCHKKLIVEIMGKYSNIIFTDENNIILDAIKKISSNVSSVREVLPGRTWFIPDALGKRNPLEAGEADFLSTVPPVSDSLKKALYTTFTGLSPLMATEICYRAGLDADSSTAAFSEEEYNKLWLSFSKVMNDIKNGAFSSEVIFDKGLPLEYGVMELSMFNDFEKRAYDSISSLLIDFYKEKSMIVRIRQKSADLRKIVTTALERNVKKLDLQTKQLADTEKREKYKIYGELINTYGYSVPDGSKSFEALNYYTNENITIPLDPELSVKDNAKKYFEKYSKLKRTAESLTEIIKDVSAQVEHLESVQTALDIALLEEDLVEIKQELIDAGYIRAKAGGKKQKITSKPFHYISSDGFDIYVGKNNFQNDWLTFEFANGNDWWFHAKKQPGSHVVVRTNGSELPDRTFEEAARLAAFYSKGRSSGNVEIDYTIKKNVKKPAGSNPGFVVYHTNYSMVIDTNITDIEQIS